MANVQVTNLTKIYGTNTVLNQINLEVPDGTLVSLLGPSGCGKTTTLRLIAGFEQADGGDIYIEGQRVNEVNVNKRNIGMVFQSYALFPHMTVEENVAYGLEQRKLPKGEIKKRVKETIQLVQLEGFEKRKPKQLSGGQQQRVALARALVIQPKILLLDECLSALDKKLRIEMQVELRRILEKSKITALFVTHDQEEALTLSDMIVVMHRGKIEQMGKPFEVYERPRNQFVASFLGKANFFEGTVLASEELSVTLRTVYGEMRVATMEPAEKGVEAVYAVRPEKMQLFASAKEGSCIEGTIQFVTYAGNISTYTLDCHGMTVLVETQNVSQEGSYKPGDRVFVGWEAAFGLKMEDVSTEKDIKDAGEL